MEAQGLSANENFLNATYDELALERYAMKVHGYVFSDERDGSTDSGGVSEFDEKYALLKPPPIEVDPDKVIVINPKNSNTTKRKYRNVQKKKHDVMKTKKCSYAKGQKGRYTFNVSVNNFYALLEDESDKELEIENNHYNKASSKDRMISRRKKKKRKNQVKNETRLYESSPGHCLWDNIECRHQNCQTDSELNHVSLENKPLETKYVRNHDDDEKYILDLEYLLGCIPWYPWTNEARGILNSLQIKIETQRTSWDDISTNLVHRSDRLLEQEYCEIIGTKVCSHFTGYEYRRTTALKNLSEVTGMPCVAFIAKKFWTVLDNDTFLNVVGILITAFIYTRCK